MFIPLRDSTFRLKTPYITYLLIAINFFVYFYQLTIPRPEYREWFYTAGVIPTYIFRGGIAPSIFPFITSLFVHGGFLHVAGNMLYLWIFGDNIESLLGHAKFVIFYISCGIFATLVQILVNPSSNLPIVGASGAISGILGAYILRYPRARIQVLIWLFIFIKRVWIPAVYVLGFWFIVQLSSGIGALAVQQGGGVAWFAHIGGFLAGIALLLAMDPYERRRLWKKLNREY
ncbi:MAG: rhomboid family intramembrane serine protease [Candidatus Neomarinimicrobiota bacterium]|nr:MAG: rhomboid family intramembrane serine protease [Candidatus Neomarinimicrobiota bacterium]